MRSYPTSSPHYNIKNHFLNTFLSTTRFLSLFNKTFKFSKKQNLVMKKSVNINVVILLVAAFLAVVALSGTFSELNRRETVASVFPSPTYQEPTKCCFNIITSHCYVSSCQGENEYDVECGSPFCK